MNTSELYYLYEEVGHPNLSCSGDKIVFSVWGRHYEKYEMWIINRDGTGLKKLCDKGTYPDLSPDGKRVVYEKPGEGIWIINADGTGDHQITNNSTDAWPTWSPAGDKIAFSREQHILALVDTNGANYTELWVGPSPDTSGGYYSPSVAVLDWSWDGTMITLGSVKNYCFEGDSMTATISGVAFGKFSPDGTMFVGGHGSIVTINIDGSNRQTILAGRDILVSRGLW